MALSLITAAFALGLAGVLIKGLVCLLITGVVVPALDLIPGGHRLGKHRAVPLPHTPHLLPTDPGQAEKLQARIPRPALDPPESGRC